MVSYKILFSCWIFDSQKCSLPGNVRDHPRVHRDLRKFDTEKEVEVGGMGMEVGDRGGRNSQDWTRKRERECVCGMEWRRELSIKHCMPQETKGHHGSDRCLQKAKAGSAIFHCENILEKSFIATYRD